MKKRFWVRLISAVLTMAMAFSILAVPASAADIKLTAIGAKIGDIVEDPANELTVWFTQDELEEEIWTAYEQLAQTGITEYSGVYLYTKAIPTGKIVGFSSDPDSRIFWYTKEAIDMTDGGDFGLGDIELDSTTGVLSIGSIKIKPINYSGSSTGGSASVSASADGGAAILLVGGAAVAATAATGLYFYTHPEKVQEIKDSVHAFVENVQNKFQSILPSRDVEEAPAA